MQVQQLTTLQLVRKPRKKWYLVNFTEPNQNPDTDTIDAPDMIKARLWFMDNRHPTTVIQSIHYINI